MTQDSTSDAAYRITADKLHQFVEQIEGLEALLDPAHEELDYLRIDPDAGKAERERRAALAEGGDA